MLQCQSDEEAESVSTEVYWQRLVTDLSTLLQEWMNGALVKIMMTA
jgi:hypothetical protein